MYTKLSFAPSLKSEEILSPQSHNNKLLGIIIAGGLSSRMGKQKPTLKVYGENEPNMLERTGYLLSKYTGQTWVSCRKKQLETSYPCIYDSIEGLGPIGGLCDSLKAIKNSAWDSILVLSCDLPFMNEDTIFRLILARNKAITTNPKLLMTTYQQAETGYIEALVAIYEKPALDLFNQALTAGNKRINLIIPKALRHDIIYKSNEALPFFNINYPQDLEKAEKIIGLT